MHLARIQLFTLFRDTKWIAAVSIALATLLYFPAQISELYRAILADQNLSDLVQFGLPLLALGIIVWFGANQIALESTYRQPMPHSRLLEPATRVWPVLLGILPVGASALGQYMSIPINADDATAALDQGGLLPGSPFFQFDEMLTKTVGQGLRWSSLVTIVVAVLVAAIVLWHGGKWQRALHVANHRFFIRWRMLFTTVALIAAITCLMLYAPVWLPQHLGTFLLISIFALLIVGFCLHVSLATIHRKYPIFPVIFFLAVVFSLADRTDNHEIRLLGQPPSKSGQYDAASEFKQWFESRDDIKQYKQEYPVYVVAAQGGGIYAAYETRSFWRGCRISAQPSASIYSRSAAYPVGVSVPLFLRLSSMRCRSKLPAPSRVPRCRSISNGAPCSAKRITKPVRRRAMRAAFSRRKTICFRRS